MNQKLLSILPLVATLSAAAQSPSPAAQAPIRPDSIVETSRISRFLAGPGARPQGFLLRNGTFVTLPPGLAGQLPTALEKNATIRVAGEEVSYNGNRTIAAQSITLAGVAYSDAGPAAVAPPAASGRALASAPPPPPGRPGAGVPGPIAPPPPPACGPGAPPPAPTAGRTNAPAPPTDLAPPPPAPVEGVPARPAVNTQAGAPAPPPQN
jgi:hypothetical protein